MNKKNTLIILLALLIAPTCMAAKKKVKKVEKVEVPQLLNYPSAEISEYRLHGGNVVIQGHLELPDEAKGEKIPQEVLDKINGYFSVVVRNYIVDKEEESLIEFKNDGTFSLNVYVPYPMPLLVYPLGMAYGCPGDTINITLDMKKPSLQEGVTFDGTGLGGEVSRTFQPMWEKYHLTSRPSDEAENNLDSLMMWKDRQVAEMDELVRKMNDGLPELADCSPLASDILRTFILGEYMSNICGTFMMAEDLLDNDNTISRDDYWQQFFSFVAPREKYLTDNPLLLIAGDWSFFNRMQFQVFRPTKYSVLNYIPFDYDPKKAEHMAEVQEVFRRDNRKYTLDLLQEKLHISPNDFSVQVVMLLDFFGDTRWNKGQYDVIADDFACTMNFVSHPELIRQGVLAFREFIKENEIKVAEDKPLTKGDSIFQRIIEPYKGNVLYVDFWEMSCGPCRAGMLAMRDEVKANKDRPVKYLYVTDDTPEECKSFLEPNKIQGEHIHVTRSEWGYLRQKFQFSSIPFVVHVDKQGRVREDVTVEQLLSE
jgi:thiol-disulfide isomerase/thioredoxin